MIDQRVGKVSVGVGTRAGRVIQGMQGGNHLNLSYIGKNQVASLTALCKSKTFTEV